MKNWKQKMSRTLVSLITSLAFLNSSFVFAAGNDSNWVNTSTGLIQQFGGMLMGAKQNEAMMRQQAAMMQAMQPKPTPSLFFKHCMVGPAKAAVPENMCSNISHPGQLQSIEGGTMAVILQNISFYDQLLSDATNSATPPGIKCLSNAQARLDTQMQQQLNSLQALIDSVKERSEKFRDFADAAKARMTKTKDELEGGGEAASKDFNKEFNDKACSDVIPNVNGLAQKGGYNSLIKVFDAPAAPGGQSLRSMADNLNQNSGKIRANINNQISKLKNDIYKRGVGDFLASGGRVALGDSKLKIASVETVIQNKINDFNIAKARIEKELKIVGHELPPLDANFDKNATTFTRGAKSFFEKRYVDECVTMKGGNGVGLTNQQVLDSIRQTSTGNRGTTIIAYKKTLSNILNSDASIEDKMASIQKLDLEYNGSNIVVNVTNEQAQTVTTTTYQLYGDLINRCRQVYAQDNTFSSSNPNKISDKEQVERAKKSLDEIVNLNREFATELARSITNSVDNCVSEESNLQGSCGPETLDMKKPSFCLTEAQQCSSNIVSCQAKLAEKVSVKRKSIQAEAANYNSEFKKLMDFQRGSFKNFRAIFAAQRDQLSQFLPKADWELKEDSYIKTPGMKEASGLLGEDLGKMAQLVDGGGLGYLDELPAKLGKLKESMAQQKRNANASVEKHISEQKEAMQANRKQWENVKKVCQENAAKFRAMIAKQNEEGQKTAAEKEKEVADFCTRFNDLADTNPGAGCGDVDALYEDSTKVASFINPEIRKDLGKYRTMCDQQQTEGSTDTKSNAKDIVQLCADNGNDWSAVVSSLLKKTVANYNAKFGKDEKDERIDASDLRDITDYLNGNGGKMPDKFRDSDLKRQVDTIMNIKNTQVGSSGSARPASQKTKAEKIKLLNKQKSQIEASLKGIQAEKSYLDKVQPKSEIQSSRVATLEREIAQENNELDEVNNEIAEVDKTNDSDKPESNETQKLQVGNICQAIDEAIDRAAEASLKSNADQSLGKKDAEIEVIKKNPGRYITGVNTINSKLSSFDAELVGDVGSQWSEMGESASGCRSMAIGQRNMFDVFGGQMGQPNGNMMFNTMGR